MLTSCLNLNMYKVQESWGCCNFPVWQYTEQPSQQNKCWQCTFLQLYLSLGFIFKFMLWQCCAHGPARCRHKDHLVRVRKRSCFDHHKHSLRFHYCHHKDQFCVTTNRTGNYPIFPCSQPEGLPLRNVETQSRTAVTGLERSRLTPQP